jgi:18S rRNA (adenine1779-N6/adenine1780-N6)-dimethyltransferase
MVRLLFNRKNKTLRSVLMTKPTIKMLEENRRTHLSLNTDSKKDGDDEMKDTQSIEQIIEEVTGKEEWVGRRSSKLDLDDFLSLLADFNSRGIHFA